MYRLLLQGPVPAQLPLDAPVTLGSAQGLSAGTVWLRPARLGAVLEASCPVSLGAELLGRGVRRLVRPGEPVRVGEVTLVLEHQPLPSPSTRLLARALLGGPPTADVPGERPCLIWLTGPELGRTLILEEGATFLGRGEGCAARIDDARCARLQARIVRTGKTLRLVALQASAPLVVDGVALSGSRELRGGEILCVGDAVLRVELPGKPAETPAEKPVDAAAVVAAPPPAPPPPAPEPPAPPPGATPRSWLSHHERALLGLAVAALLACGALAGWALR